MSPRWFLGLGSNLGDRRSFLAAALREIGSLPRTVVTGLSSVYLTAPVGKVEQPLSSTRLLKSQRFLLRVRCWRPPRRSSVVWGESARKDGDRATSISICFGTMGLLSARPDWRCLTPSGGAAFRVGAPGGVGAHLRLPSGLTVADALAWVRGQQVRRLEAGVDMAHGSEVEDYSRNYVLWRGNATR